MRVTIATLVAALASSAMAKIGAPCAALKNYKMTFYGFPDNDPPGPATQFKCGGRGNKASGNGTYANPLTMATELGHFEECEIVYSPYLKKYLRNEDSCANCSGEWVDVWLGSTTANGGSPLLSCQNTLTAGDSANRAIVTNPPADLPVSAAELFNGGACNTNLVNAALDAIASCTGSGLGGSVPGAGNGVISAPPSTPTTLVSMKKHWHHKTASVNTGYAGDY